MRLWNVVVALIYNTKAGTWHPAIFSGHDVMGHLETSPARHRSRNHHTAGFATKELAESAALTDLVPRILDNGVADEVRTAFDWVFTWDGEGVPTETAFFDYAQLPVAGRREPERATEAPCPG